MPSGSSRDQHELDPVGFPPVVLPPSHLPRVAREVGASDVMMRPDLSAAQPGEVAFGLIAAGVGLAIIVAVFALGDSVAETYESVARQLSHYSIGPSEGPADGPPGGGGGGEGGGAP